MIRQPLLHALAAGLLIGLDTVADQNARELRQRNMKFGQPLLTTELSGSMGGATASSARGGLNYFRVRRRPSNPRSTRQSITRLILSSCAAAWPGLPVADQDTWIAQAGTNESGISLFVKVNSQIELAGNTRLDSIPGSPSLPATPLSVISQDQSAKTIIFTNTDSDGDLYVNVYATAPQRYGQRSRKFSYRYVGTVNLAAPGANALAIPTNHPAYNALVGDITYIRFVQVNVTAGKVAIPQENRTTVVA